jgi:hypothetical protein
MVGTLSVGLDYPNASCLGIPPLAPRTWGALVSWPIPGHFPTSGTKSGKAFGRPRVPTETEQRIRDALATPGRPAFHKIAAQFDVATGTVQRIAAGALVDATTIGPPLWR